MSEVSCISDEDHLRFSKLRIGATAPVEIVNTLRHHYVKSYFFKAVPLSCDARHSLALKPEFDAMLPPTQFVLFCGIRNHGVTGADPPPTPSRRAPKDRENSALSE